MRGERQLDAANLTPRVVLANQGDQLLATRDGQLLTRERGALHLLEELVHIDLLEQKASGVEDILAFTDHVILDRQELVGQRSTMGITRRENLELALTIHDERLDHSRHGSILGAVCGWCGIRPRGEPRAWAELQR